MWMAIEIGTSNPWVFFLLPVPIPIETLTLSQGYGFSTGVGRGAQGLQGYSNPCG